MKIFTLILLFFCTLQVTAQDFKTNWGKVVSLETRNANYFNYMRMLKIIDGHYYVESRGKKSSKLFIYTMDHKLVAETAISFEDKDLKLSNVMKTPEGVYAYFYEDNKKKKKINIYLSKIEEGKFGTLSTPIDLEYGKKSMSGERGIYYMDAIGYDFNFTSDSSSIAFTSAISTKRSKDPEKVKVVMMDKSLNRMWEKVYEFPLEDERTNIQSSVISEEGKIYYLAKYSKRLSKPSKKLPSDTYKIIEASEKDWKIYDIDLEDGREITKIGLYPSKKKNQAFHIAGVYTTKETKTREGEGVFYQRFDAINNRLDAPITKKLTRGVHVNLKLRKNRKGKEREVKDEDPYTLNDRTELEDLFSYDDGSFGFICEDNYIFTDTKGGQVRQRYYSSDIMVYIFNADGTLRQATEVSKNYGGDYGSYACAFKNDKIYLMCNTGISRGKMKGEKKKPKYPQVYTGLVIVDSKTGELVASERMFRNPINQFIFNPAYGKFNEDYFLFGKQKDEKCRFGTIKLN